ncbi:DUF3140 domain-containing protein [Streptomyces arboris]|uniref:DUF3140 domain-containing protein n=1 Tax=Streptomyces arboris TaxID=2600619 RepID=UPI00363085B7
MGQKNRGGESTGHASGRRIVKLLRTRQEELGDADLAPVVRQLRRPSGERRGLTAGETEGPSRVAVPPVKVPPAGVRRATARP